MNQIQAPFGDFWVADGTFHAQWFSSQSAWARWYPPDRWIASVVFGRAFWRTPNPLMADRLALATIGVAEIGTEREYCEYFSAMKKLEHS